MLKILDSYKDIIDWRKYIKNISHPSKTIFLLPDYINAHIDTKSKGKLLLYIKDKMFFLHVFVINEVTLQHKIKFKDISNPFGCNGSITNIKDKLLLKKINSFYENFIEKNDILLELSMIFSDNPDFVFPYDYKKKNVKKVCFINLKKKNNSILKSKNQNMVRKALSNGLKSAISFEIQDLEEFIKIYLNFLKRIKADKKYFLKKNFLKYAKELLKNKNLFFIKITDKNNYLISMGLFLCYNKQVIYHYSASTNKKIFNGSFELMLFECYKFSKDFGYNDIYLGGGLTDSLDDNLFKFKKKLSDKLSNFYVIEKVFNKKLYKEIQKNSKIKNKNKLIFYR